MASARILCFGAYEADLDAGELRKQGVKIGLPEQVFRFLAALLERPGEIITREELQTGLDVIEQGLQQVDAGLATVNREELNYAAR